MSNRADQWDRRKFLRGAALAGSAGLVGLRPDRALAEPPPETTKIRLVRIPGICIAPQYVADDLLRSEGFTEVSYIGTPAGVEASRAAASGEADFTMAFAGPFIVSLDAGHPVVLLAGVHVGCFELFATERRSEEHTSELQSRLHLVCRLLLEKKKKNSRRNYLILSNISPSTKPTDDA